MQQASGNDGRVKVQVGQDLSDGQAVLDIRLARGTGLAFVCHRRQFIGAPNQVPVGRGQVAVKMDQQRFQFHHAIRRGFSHC